MISRKENIYKKINSGEKLAILSDINGNILFETSESPVSKLFKEYFNNRFDDGRKYFLYVNQFGLGMVIFVELTNVYKCFALKASTKAIQKIKDLNINLYYDKEIPFVFSSKDKNYICPIEEFLSNNSDRTKQLKFLKNISNGVCIIKK